MIKLSNRAAQLDHARVADCMHHGIVSCPAGSPLAKVAAVMARNRVHAVAVTEVGEERPVGFVSDLDIVAARHAGAREPRCRPLLPSR